MWSKRARVLGMAASATTIMALTVGGVTAATNPSGTAGTAQQVPQIAQSTRMHQFGHGGEEMHGMAGRVLHGEFVVPKPGGGYLSVLFQRGTAQAVSPSQVTLKSQDGFSKAYVINNSTLVNAGPTGISSVKKGAKLSVVATVSGHTATAVHITDVSLVKSLLKKYEQEH
ncbi:hypothetical protein [Actinopolymorpha alba]|uniref:hypothetical protein n=1 Tax=Actinopolymorpha alba TaxID=533267 RepID=UPI0012F6BB9E|nr:hypothetical protein [Actinopolymorpha alba]